MFFEKKLNNIFNKWLGDILLACFNVQTVYLDFEEYSLKVKEELKRIKECKEKNEKAIK